MENEKGVNIPEKETEVWIRRLRILRHESLVAKRQAEFLKNTETSRLSFNPKDTYEAIKIGNEVEEKYLSRKDFEKIRKTDPGYQRLVEDFAGKLATVSGFGGISVIEKASLVATLEDQARELKEKADEIARKHDTPKEKAQYAIFATRAFLFKTGPVWYKGPEGKEIEKLMPKGIAQIKKDLKDMDKEMGTYKLSLLGRNLGEREMSRLEALIERSIFNVAAVSPTKPFLTEQPRVGAG